MTEELRLHLEQRTRENIAAGMTSEEARDAALRRFGGLEQAKELARAQRTIVWLEQTGQDVRYAARAWRRNPGFAAVAILTLALGIGASTALFTFAHALAWRALPVTEPERLVLVRSTNGDESFSYASYERFRDGARAMSGLALARRGTNPRQLVVGGEAGESDTVRAQLVTGNYFALLGARAALGRVFAAEEDRMDRPQAALVISHAFWQRRFGGDPNVIGRAVQLDNVPFTIVGVMPAGFVGFELGVQPDVWWPLPMFPQVEADARSLERLRDEGWEWALVFGRLAQGVERRQAQAELDAIFQRQRVAYAAERAKWTEKQRREYLSRTIELSPGGAGFTPLRKNLAQAFKILALVVGSVLAIACANLAGLLLARGAARQRELAVRVALGAGQARLLRQLLTESLLLALLGGLAGMGLGRVGTVVLASFVPQAQALDLSADWEVTVFALGVALLTGIAFGLAPALRLTRGGLMASGRGEASGGRSRLNQALVVAQIAVTVVLLAGAGLFVRTLQKLRATELGFRPENVVGFSLGFGRAYNVQQRAQVHRQLLEALAAQPDVRSATLSGAGLFSGNGFGIRVRPEGYVPQLDEDPRALVVVAGPRFFSTLGIPLRSGRDFTEVDEKVSLAPGVALPSAPRVAVVGESFARRYFGEANPIGRTFRFGLNEQNPPVEIIGVAADVKYRSVREKPELEIYVPYFSGVMNLAMTVRVATRSDSRAFASTVRALVKQVDPHVAVSEVRALNEVVDESLMRERMLAQLGGFFGLFALGLASVGLYGLLAYSVAQRTREIGVRMALGASVREVLALVVGQGVRLAAVGAGIGLAAALALMRFVETMFYGVSPHDPATFAGVVALLLGVAALAAWLPARRAARVDPMVALRAE